MTNNRVAFVFALGLAVLALFMLSGAEAGTINLPKHSPTDEERLDPAGALSISVTVDADDGDGITSLVAIFENGYEVDLECDDADCDGTGDNIDGIWSTPGTLTAGDALDEADYGDTEIKYKIEVVFTDGEEGFQPGFGFNETGIRVNTIPELDDDAEVTGDDMPYSTRTVTVTYRDEDGHAGDVSAEVCEDSNPSSCETSFSLSNTGGDEKTGATYSAEFTTAFGGDLTITVSATDGFDAAVPDRTAAFSVDTDKPWLVSDLVSPTSATTSEEITFSVVYCVWEAQTGAEVSVDVGSDSYNLDEGGAADEGVCVNGVGTHYSVSDTVDWDSAAQDVTFLTLNDADLGEDLPSSAVTINDLPTMSDNSAEKVGDNFVIKITASDINIGDGDSLTVEAFVQYHTGAFVMVFADPHYEVTIPEDDIKSDRGGIRAVTFEVSDLHGPVVPGDFGDEIDVAMTSSFAMVIKGDGSTDLTTAYGTNTYTYTITNNGNSEDTFTITTDSVNGWFSAVAPVVVGFGSSADFDVTVTIPKVLAGTKDTWSVTSAASNDVTVDDEVVSGTTTVDTTSGHDLTGDSDRSGNPDSSITYYFTILNTGNAHEGFDYTVVSSNGWTLNTPGGSSALDMGASDTITVTHDIPDDAAADAIATVTFTVLGGSVSAVTTTANQEYAVSVSAGTLTGLKPGESRDGEEAGLSFTVTNDGNGADTFSLSYSGIWATGISDADASIFLGAGQEKSIYVSVQIPADAASAASSTVGLSASGADAGSSDSYDVVVASSTRSLTITGADAYTFNEGTVGQGTATIQNNGVSTTFIVTSMSDSISFATSSYAVDAGASQEITFNIMATASGDQSFTISDNVDFNPKTHTFALTARTFSTVMSAWGLAECSNSGATCTYDMDSWDGSAYANAGTWTTTLDYVDANGQTGSHTFDTTIVNSNPTVALPSLDNPVQGTEQQFSFTIPTDADGTVTHLVIEFGDGEEQTFQTSDFDGQTVTATHTYSKSGNFDVVATAYDNSGGSTSQTVAVSVGDEMVTLEGSSYTYNLIALLGFFLLGAILSGTAFKMQQGEIAGDEEMNERDRQRLESVERRMESISEREELMEVSAYDASRAATKLEEHIAAFNSILVKAQEIAAEDKLKELEAAEESRKKKDEEMQLDLEDPDIEMVAERFHGSLARLVEARDDLSKIEKQLAGILKMERDEQLEKLTEMTDSYESTKRKINALESSKEARDAAAVENNIMNLLSAAASGGSVGGADFGDFGDDDEYEVEIYEDEDGSFYYIDPDTGEEVPCDEDGNAL